jgi:hypothetical protein
MKRIPKLIISLMMVILSINALKAQSTTDEMTKEFFSIYGESPQNAVDYIFNTNKWMAEKNMEGIENLKGQLNILLGQVGGYCGHEKITEKSLGESFKLISYMIKYDRQPVRFTFIFYKPKDNWEIQNFQFDDNLDDELEEAAKVFRLREMWE